jgi:hypothetical protein
MGKIKAQEIARHLMMMKIHCCREDGERAWLPSARLKNLATHHPPEVS